MRDNNLFCFRQTLIALFFSILFWSRAFPAIALDKPTVIVNAMIFDSAGMEPYKGNVVIEGGVITKVGGDVSIPKKAVIVDAKGKALLPGLFDLHTHWTPGSVPASYPKIAMAYLSTGVTTVNDFHQQPESFEPRRRWLAMMYAPHVNFAARISTPLGHGADWADENTTKWVNSPEAARAAVDAVAKYKPDLIKAFTDGWRYGMGAENTSMDVATLSALVDEAHKYNLKVLTHTVTVDRGRDAAIAKVDVIAHSLQDRPIDDDTVALIKKNGTFYAPTLAVYEPVKPGQKPMFPMDDPRTKSRMEKWGYALGNVKKLHDAGVPIVVGTDAGMFPHKGATARELELLVKAGLTPDEAIIAATSASARAIGLENDRGSIKEGKRADLILVDGRPWVNIYDIEKIEGVFVDGKLIWGRGIKIPEANLVDSMAAIKINSIVDDFERRDGRSNLDALPIDEADGGLDRTWQVSEIIPRGDSGHALSVQADFSSKPQPYASAILPLSRGSVEPVDLREYKALRFDVRSNYPLMTVEFRGVSNGRWSHAFKTKPEWQVVEVPFSSLKTSAPTQGGNVNAWTGANLQQIVFTIEGISNEKGWFEIDNVEFVR